MAPQNVLDHGLHTVYRKALEASHKFDEVSREDLP